MRNFFIALVLLVSNISFAEEAILLFYPSYKWAEMSGGYPAEAHVQFYYKDMENVVDGNLNSSRPVIHYEDNANPSKEYDIQFVKHADFCPCNGKYEQRQLPVLIKESILYLNGHYYHINFMYGDPYCLLKSY